MERDGIEKSLKAHARTFALTLRLLPKALREPLGIAYLLARASDTIADARGISREQRIALLEDLEAALAAGEPLRWQPEIALDELSSAEAELIATVPMLIVTLKRQADGAGMLRLWRTILEGQLFDLRRFTPDAPPLSREELERYCWLVAGSVGEAWTKLILKHAPEGIVSLPPDAGGMTALGSSYGMGLQLINILRDRTTDRGMGRIYAPEAELGELMELASVWLAQGELYLAALRPGRIRYASEIPLRLALRTLERLRRAPDAPHVKLKRGEVYALLVRTLPSLGLRGCVNPAS